MENKRKRLVCFAKWMDKHPELETVNPEDVIRKAQEKFQELSLEWLEEYFLSELRDNAPKVAPGKDSDELFPVLRSSKGKVYYVDNDGIIRLSALTPKEANVKALEIKGCMQRWRSACVAVKDGDTMKDLCYAFIASYRKKPEQKPYDEIDRFALTVETECGNIIDHDENEIDWITCCVTLGTQYGDSTADAVRHFSKEIGQKVVQSIKDMGKIPEKDFPKYYLKSKEIWGGYLLQYTFAKKEAATHAVRSR
jgi:hypothetical protein